jgi:hypothetical protein
VGSREIRVRQVDPALERERILTVLALNLPAAAAPERFDWLYLSNPDGPALVWLAEYENGEPTGTSAAHPRRMHVGGDRVVALNLGDFAIDRSQRTLGLALRLLGATLAPVRDRAYAFSYDFGNASMQAVYRRMGVHGLGRNERWMQPIAMRRVLRGKLGTVWLATVAGAAGDALWHVRRSIHGRAKGLRLDGLAGECGEEFDALDARLARRRRVTGVRDAAYLSWRYLRNPVWKHEIVCARADGRLVGYAVLRRTTPDTVALVDVQGEDMRVCRALLSAAVRGAAAQNAAALHVEVLAGSEAAHMIKALGFIRRESDDGPVVFWPPACPLADDLAAAQHWWLIGGDRDV